MADSSLYQDRTLYSSHQMRNRVIEEARAWIKTPYQHQGMVKGVGVDCVGLIAAVGINTGVLAMTPEHIRQYSGYGRLPNPRKMGEYMEQHLNAIPDSRMEVADIAWIEWRKNMPMHLAIIGSHNDNFTLIHATSDVGMVVEHTLSSTWMDRICSFWRYPGI